VELRVRLFGEIDVTHGDQRVRFSSVKALELLCLLLLHSHRQHTREALAEVLWPAGQPAVVKRYLRQTLWRLGGALEAGVTGGVGHRPLVVTDPNWVRIGDPASWWVDVHEVNRAYLRARDTPSHDLTTEQVRDLEVALEMHRGELMASWYQDWCMAERDRHRHLRSAILEKLAGYCEAHLLLDRGLDHAKSILWLDPARESAHQQVMRIAYRMGDRGAALRQYQKCAAALHDEFGIAPSAGTEALYERVRVGIPLDADRAGVTSPLDDPAGLHARLDEMNAGIRALHELVGRHLGLPREAAHRVPGPARQAGELHVLIERRVDRAAAADLARIRPGGSVE
jgi:DNA-binding SARP family transcriptional activator